MVSFIQSSRDPDLTHFGRWTLSDKAAQSRLAVRS